MLYSLTNYVHDLNPRPINPEEAQGYFIPETIQTKAQKTEWEKTCKHAFISANLGAVHSRRISAENPIASCTGIIVDYDNPACWEMVRVDAPWKDKPQPTWISKSFSGGVHAFYQFSESLSVITSEIWTKFVKKLSSRLKLKAILPGLDERALVNPSLFYEPGREWTKLGEPLERDLYFTCFIDALTHASVSKDGEDKFPEIPLDLVEKQVHQQYPGRWEGEFKVNSRGCRFWDMDADAQSCLVKPEGMICFTGDAKFVPWSAILDRAFISKYTEDRMGRAIEGIYWDNQLYWVYNKVKNKYLPLPVGELRNFLKTDRRLYPNTPKGATGSEVDFAVNNIKFVNGVENSIPCVSYPHGIINVGGEQILNTYTGRPTSPTFGEVTPKDFPWIWNFISDFFDPHEQVDYFLSWLRVAYYNQYYNLGEDARIGHVAFLAGPVSQGKTFLCQFLVAELLGGFKDAADYLMGRTNFNGHLFKAPVWYMGDETLGGYTKEEAYANALKRIGAEECFSYNEKFRPSALARWKGRCLIACNMDVESIRMIPNLTINNDTKLSIFNVSSRTPEQRGFREDFKTLCRAELPYFAKFLLDYKIPEHIQGGDMRYTIKNYLSPIIVQTANSSNETSHFHEMLYAYMEAFFNSNDKVDVWTGSTHILYGQMTECPVTKAATNKMDIGKFARKLNSYSTTKGINSVTNRAGIKQWLFTRDFVTDKV